MTTLDSLAEKLESVFQRHEENDKEIITRLDRINGTIVEHSERLVELEKEDVRNDGNFKLISQDIQNFKGQIGEAKATGYKMVALLVAGVGAITGIINLITR